MGAPTSAAPDRRRSPAERARLRAGCLRVPPTTQSQGRDIVLTAVVAVAFDRNLCSGRAGWGCCCTTLAGRPFLPQPRPLYSACLGSLHLLVTGSIYPAHIIWETFGRKLRRSIIPFCVGPPHNSAAAHALLETWVPSSASRLRTRPKSVSCQPHALMGLATCGFLAAFV